MANGSNLHSSGQKTLPIEDLPEPIQKAFQEVQAAISSPAINCLNWNENYIAVSLTVSVDLPTGGPVNDIDIRDREPILFLFHRTRYPRTPPIVFSDRKDFPVERLPHLNTGSALKPASLCLHRGSLRDWFAEHSLADLVGRVRGWFRDAASNRLIREEDRFEGTRIQDATGAMIYLPADLISHVERRWQELGGSSGYAFVMATLLKNKSAKEHYSNQISYHINFSFPEPPAGKVVDIFRKYNRIVGEAPDEDKLLFGLLVWGPQNPLAEYFGSLPSKFAELKTFCARIGVPLEAAVEAYWGIAAQMLGGVPLIIAMLRPQKLIGSDSCVELLHLAVLVSDEYSEEDGRWKDEAPVLVLSHRTPLTVAFARNLSREEPNTPSQFALVGCGAVGSKLSLHLAKAGHCHQTLIDEADLFPHHLVRHGLPPYYVGKNKADALKEYITSMYRLDQDNLKIQSMPVSFDEILDKPETLDSIPLLIDATASSAVLNDLIVSTVLPKNLHCSRCEIADEGRLGLVFWEGKGRNPRIDDLQAILFNLGQQVPVIAQWLTRHRKGQEGERAAVLEEIGIGLSCSSATFRLADDIVSLHAAVFSAAYKERDRWLNEEQGKIQVAVFHSDDVIGTQTLTFSVSRVLILDAKISTPWQVRIHAHAVDKIRSLMKRAGKRETGGLLLGHAHRKRKVIYVTDMLPPSKDSKGTPYAFKRGVKDYPEILDRIEANTGGLIGYVGEWHTHPHGLAALSATDHQAVRNIRKHLDSVGLPTHILVFGEKEVASFVFTGDY